MTTLFEGDYKDGRRLIRIDNIEDLFNKEKKLLLLLMNGLKSKIYS